mgnify:CR=1 FL=1
MASVPVSHLILFVASLVIAAGVVGTVTTGVDRVSEAVEDGSIDATQQLRTDVTVISDPNGGVYDSNAGTDGNVTVLVKNTGQKTLAADGTELDVLVDGEYQIIANATVVGAPDAHAWRSGEVLRVTVTRSLDTGSHRIAVHANGDTATIRFRTD